MLLKKEPTSVTSRVHFARKSESSKTFTQVGKGTVAIHRSSRNWFNPLIEQIFDALRIGISDELQMEPLIIDWKEGRTADRDLPAHHLLRLEGEQRQDVRLALAAESADGADHGDGRLLFTVADNVTSAAVARNCLLHLRTDHQSDLRKWHEGSNLGCYSSILLRPNHIKLKFLSRYSTIHLRQFSSRLIYTCLAAGSAHDAVPVLKDAPQIRDPAKTAVAVEGVAGQVEGLKSLVGSFQCESNSIK